MNVIVAILVAVLLQSPLQFEVASVKENRSGFGFADMDFPPNGRVHVENATLKELMRWSYRLQDYQIIGGPAWLDADRFDIQAKPAADFEPKPARPCLGPDCPFTPTQIMMQDLIGARFQLKTHRETRELPVYELTVAKGGFKLKEIPPSSTPRTPVIPPPPPPGTAPPTNPAALPTPPDGSVMVFGSGFTGASIPLAALASTLSGILGRPVIDKTRLKGEYDFKFVYSRSGLPHNGLLSGGPAAPPAALDANDPMPSIFTAVQEQLGLKLDSTKGPVEVVVVDSVSKPIEN